MTPNEYQQLALRTENTPCFVAVQEKVEGDRGSLDRAYRVSRLLHGLIGICTEAGEAQDMVKKTLIYGKPLDLVNIMEEMGDLCWYIALTLDAAGYSFEQAMERNISKLKARYGDKFSEEKALNRDLNAERTKLEGK